MSESPSLALHRKLRGKLRIQAAYPVSSPSDLAMLYTPGVAEACLCVRDDPSLCWELTGRGNTVAVVSDGSAVLGLGNIGPLAGMPVMEGKALLFRQFAGIDAVPLVLDTQDPDRLVSTIAALAPSFGGINLEDIGSPRCFEIEKRLQEVLPIPVFHDDQHGTAVVVLAGLLNALKLIGKTPQTAKVVINGAGAAGSAIAWTLLENGFHRLTVCDRGGILGEALREDTGHHADLARATRAQPEAGSLADALEGADVFIGVSAPGVLKPEMVARMETQPVVFALANPTPEILPEVLEKTHARVAAFGTSGSLNQINNLLAFPGLFRGALDVRATSITPKMRSAASHALASLVSSGDLEHGKVIPDPFDKRVVETVALNAALSAVAEGRAGRPGAEAEIQSRIRNALASLG